MDRKSTFRKVVAPVMMALFRKYRSMGEILKAWTYPLKLIREGRDIPLERISALVLKDDIMTHRMGNRATATQITRKIYLIIKVTFSAGFKYLKALGRIYSTP
jgi:hypothetical protein